jgi:hypothetical protein
MTNKFLTKTLRQIFVFLVLVFFSCNSPQRHFTKNEPKLLSLVGTYKLDLSKADCLSEIDKAKDIQFTLNADSTFSVKNFPIFNDFEKYEICNGNGNWQIERESSWGSWGVFINYKTLLNSQTGDTISTPITNYFIYGDKEPYKIYVMIGDPDTWYGMLLKK